MNEFKIKKIKINWDIWKLPIILFSSAVVLLLGGTILIQLVAPLPVHQLSFVSFMGFNLWTGLPTFILICLGIGWVLHGVGFFIVKG